MDDYSSTVGQMQTVSDPYPAASESQATSLSRELEQIRYQLKEILGETHWYIDPDTTIAALNTLTASHTTTLTAQAADIENNIVINRMMN